MPELPEVETYARDLAAVLPGRTLFGARVDWPNQLPRTTPRALSAGVRGRRIAAVRRRGKYLIIDLDAGHLLVHLKMSGRLIVAPAHAPADPHAHVVFDLDGSQELRFRDPRKFGRIYLLSDPSPILGPLGPEPLDEAFTPDVLRGAIARRRGRLKPLLLDQTFVAGLGNIYVDEALWTAGLHPLRTADTLRPAEVDGLHAAVRSVLARAVELRGSSLSQMGFRDLTGNMGEMQGSLNVFQRTGEACPRCGATIERLVVGQRGTHVCPRCQPGPAA